MSIMDESSQKEGVVKDSEVIYEWPLILKDQFCRTALRQFICFFDQSYKETTQNYIIIYSIVFSSLILPIILSYLGIWN